MDFHTPAAPPRGNSAVFPSPLFFFLHHFFFPARPPRQGGGGEGVGGCGAGPARGAGPWIFTHRRAALPIGNPALFPSGGEEGVGGCGVGPARGAGSWIFIHKRPLPAEILQFFPLHSFFVPLHYFFPLGRPVGVAGGGSGGGGRCGPRQRRQVVEFHTQAAPARGSPAVFPSPLFFFPCSLLFPRSVVPLGGRGGGAAPRGGGALGL